MDESVAQLLALLFAVVFWIAEALLRRRQRGAASRDGAGTRDSEASQSSSGGQVAFPGSSARSVPKTGASVARSQGSPRAREAADRVWRRRVRSERVKREHDRYIDVLDEIWDLSSRLEKLERQTEFGLRPAVSRVRDLLEGIEAQVGGPDPGGAELERFAQTLGVAGRAVDVLESLSQARRGESGRWLRLSDRVLAAISETLPGLASGPALALHRGDMGWQRTLVEAGLVPVPLPEGWTDDVVFWPRALERAVKTLLRGSPLERRIFERVGLTAEWVVPYSKPVYLSSAQVVGIYGSWLSVLATDILALLLWGPSWARLVTRELTATGDDPLEVRTSPTGIHIDANPPHYLRLWCMAAVLDRFGRGADAEEVRRVVGRWAEPEQVFLSLPTRRGEHYSVEGRPFVEAGKALVEFLCDESFAILDDRSLADLWQDLQQTVRSASVRALSRAVRRDRDILPRIGAALEAFVDSDFDTRISAGLAQRALAVFEAERSSGSMSAAPAQRSAAAGEITADLIVEAVALGAVLGGPIWLPVPRPRRSVDLPGTGRGRL